VPRSSWIRDCTRHPHRFELFSVATLSKTQRVSGGDSRSER
jgi:hypothetical protein